MQKLLGSTGAVADGVRGDIRAAQVNTLFQQMPIALAVNAVNSAITAMVLQWLGAGPLAIIWFCAIALVTIGRSILWRRYRRGFAAVEHLSCWSALATCGSLLAGLCWGVGGVVLFPVLAAPGQIFLTFVIGGMCAGAVVVSASHLPTLVAFLLSASLPMAAYFCWQGAPTAEALGVMAVVFAAALSIAGMRLNRFFAETMQLRFELSAANLRLQAEIAERQATEAALRQAQKLEAVGQLTGGIAHDFNNLLTVVIGNLLLVSERAEENSCSRSLIEGALKAAERGVALIQHLLAFARKQRLDPQSVHLDRLVEGIEDLLRRTLGDQIRLVITKDADLAPAYVDANQLELAMLNLTINARDAMPGGGTLQITLQNRRRDTCSPPDLATGEYVMVSISDTGEGMDQATLTRAFDPFFTTKEIGRGSGLGLPMVQGFAAQSGGAVRIRSALGKGTTVELWLPRTSETALHVTVKREA